MQILYFSVIVKKLERTTEMKERIVSGMRSTGKLHLGLACPDDKI